MKNILTLLFVVFAFNSWRVCISPISRTNNGSGSVLTSAKYNLDANTVYNRANNLPGDCIIDESVSGTKLIDNTVTGAKITADSITTAKIVDGSVTAAKLDPAISNLVPVGVILPFGGTVAPPGFLLGQGQSLSRTTYAALFSVINTSYGSLDGVSFTAPDCRGRFIRFTDNGVGIDPDRAARTAATGGHAGDAVGSYQDQSYLAHNHIQGEFFSGSVDSLYGLYINPYTGNMGYTLINLATGANTKHPYTSTSGQNETRPVNLSANCIIKY